MAGGRPLSRTQTVSTGLGAAPSSGSRGILSAVNGAAETGRTSHRALALITEASASFLQDALLELDAAAVTHLTVASGEGGRPARSRAPGFDPRGASNSPGRHPAAPVRRVDRHPRPRPRQRQSEEESLRSERLRRSACTRWEQIATKGDVCFFCPLGLADGSRRGTRTPERLQVRKGPAFLLEVRAGGASTGLVQKLLRGGASSALLGVTRTLGRDMIQVGVDARPGLEAEERRGPIMKTCPSRGPSWPDSAVMHERGAVGPARPPRTPPLPAWPGPRLAPFAPQRRLERAPGGTRSLRGVRSQASPLTKGSVSSSVLDIHGQSPGSQRLGTPLSPGAETCPLRPRPSARH